MWRHKCHTLSWSRIICVRHPGKFDTDTKKSFTEALPHFDGDERCISAASNAVRRVALNKDPARQPRSRPTNLQIVNALNSPYRCPGSGILSPNRRLFRSRTARDEACR